MGMLKKQSYATVTVFSMDIFLWVSFIILYLSRMLQWRHFSVVSVSKIVVLYLGSGIRQTVIMIADVVFGFFSGTHSLL